MSMNRRSALSALSIGTVASTWLPSRVRAQTTADAVQIAGTQTEDMTNIYYAVKNGLFTKAGVNVELVPTSSGAVATTGVISGTYPMAKTSPLVVFSAYMKDIPIVIVLPELMADAKHPFSGLQVAPDSTIKSGSDLNGKIVAVTAIGDLNTLSIRSWVDKNGGDSRTLKYVEVPNSLTESTVAAHRVDAGILQTPQLEASIAAGTTKTIGDAWGAISPYFMVGVYVARRDWAEQHADTIKRISRAYVDAVKYVNAHPDQTTAAMLELTKIDPAKAGSIRRSTGGTSLDPALLQPVIDAAAKYGILAHAFPASAILWNG